MMTNLENISEESIIVPKLYEEKIATFTEMIYKLAHVHGQALHVSGVEGIVVGGSTPNGTVVPAEAPAGKVRTRVHRKP